MKIAIINRFFPPDGAMTGRSSQELARHLMATIPSAEIKMFCSAAEYAANRAVDSDRDVAVDRLKTLRLPVPGKGGRLVNSMIEGRELARRAVRWADLVISLTDPPLLGYWIAREIEQCGPAAPTWIEWTMDIYPEAFMSARLSTETNPFFRELSRKLQDVTPDAFICLGPKQAAYVLERRQSDAKVFVLPCGLVARDNDPGEAPERLRSRDEKILFCYAGNVGEAHCPNLLPLLVDASDPEKHAFVFSLYGTHADAVKTKVASASNVELVDYVSPEQALHADVHIASLKPEWNHVCVPSKAVSSVSLGKPMLYVGDANADNGHMLEPALWRLDRNADLDVYRRDLAEMLDIISQPGEIQRRSQNAQAVARDLVDLKRRTFADISTWIQRVLGSDNASSASKAAPLTSAA